MFNKNLVYCISKYLDHKDILNFLRTNKKFYEIYKNKNFWIFLVGHHQINQFDEKYITNDECYHHIYVRFKRNRAQIHKKSKELLIQGDVVKYGQCSIIEMIFDGEKLVNFSDFIINKPKFSLDYWYNCFSPMIIYTNNINDVLFVDNYIQGCILSFYYGYKKYYLIDDKKSIETFITDFGYYRVIGLRFLPVIPDKVANFGCNIYNTFEYSYMGL